MEAPQVVTCVKVDFRLGSETYFAEANTGRLISEQLVSIKERSMTILNDFITKHNIPDDDDVPDQVSSDDEEEEEISAATPPVKKSKRRQ